MPASAIFRVMGRPKKWRESTLARLAAGTLDRIKAALGDGEHKTDFIRTAIERELRRREGKERKPKRCHSSSG
jgi:hypothetical protein